jgi:3-oxoisoapionate decarboxylase
MEKRMKLGLHTYTLHLWGLGQNWGIQADPRPKEIDLFQLMDLAVEW